MTATLDTFTDARRNIVGLLRHWPHPPHRSSPSLLLCGPSGNGKSFLVQQCAQEAAHSAAHSSEGGDASVLVVTPSLAAAVTVRRKDGATGLRRAVREAILKAVQSKAADRGVETSVVVVLDRLEFFVKAVSNGAFSQEDSENNGDYAEGNEDSGRYARHPRLVVDLFQLLKGTPPVLSAEDVAALRLKRLLFVSVFTGEADEVEPLLRDYVFDDIITLPTPSQCERERFFLQQLCGTEGTTEASVSGNETHRVMKLAKALAMRTGGISFRGLTEVVRVYHSRAPSLIVSPSQHGESAKELAAASAAQELVAVFQSSASMAALDHRNSAGYVDVQQTRWSDIAGMVETKKALQHVLTRPMKYMSLYKRAGVLPSKGVLLYGPPGTGKTMLAKAAATELNASFLYLDLPSLVQCEVGESERRLNNFFAIAKERSPTVMFVDEMQAAFGRRYEARPSQHRLRNTAAPSVGTGSAHDARLVSHLLHLLDEAQADEDHVIVFIGATNVIDMLDPMLLRAGRLDTHIEVGLPGLDAREALARRVVVGDWRTWWATPTAEPATASHRRREEEGTHALQEAMIAAFVTRSDGYSGAEVRNATSVFALKLMQHVAQELKPIGHAPGAQESVAPCEDHGAVTQSSADELPGLWSSAIVRVLWCSEKASLTDTAKIFLELAFRPKSTRAARPHMSDDKEEE